MKIDDKKKEELITFSEDFILPIIYTTMGTLGMLSFGRGDITNGLYQVIIGFLLFVIRGVTRDLRIARDTDRILSDLMENKVPNEIMKLMNEHGHPHNPFEIKKKDKVHES